MSARRDLSAEHPRRSSCLPAAPFAGTEAIMLAHGFKSESAGSTRADGLPSSRALLRAGRRRIKVLLSALLSLRRFKSEVQQCSIDSMAE